MNLFPSLLFYTRSQLYLHIHAGTSVKRFSRFRIDNVIDEYILHIEMCYQTVAYMYKVHILWYLDKILLYL